MIYTPSLWGGWEVHSYPGLEDLTPAQQGLLFIEPWSNVILPTIASVIAEINNIRMALEEIEKAA